MGWDELYVLLVLETGWSWEYIDEEMTVPRMKAFKKVWKQTPPLRVMLRSLFSGAQTSAGSNTATSDARQGRPDMQSYLEAFGSAGLSVQVKSKGTAVQGAAT